jgi:DegV family protein with EDD domain
MCLAFLCQIAAEQDSLDAAVAACKERIPKLRILALLDTLRFIQMGGRISRIQYLLGSMLDVKAIMKVADGEITPVERTRTRAKAIPLLVEQLRKDFPLERLAVMHGSAPDDAARLRDELGAELPDLEIETAEIGSVLGTHTGPKALGFAYIVR